MTQLHLSWSQILNITPTLESEGNDLKPNYHPKLTHSTKNKSNNQQSPQPTVTGHTQSTTN